MNAAEGTARVVAAHPQWWMGLMLLALHAALAWGIADWWPRAFLLTHFGLFLLWQPVWRGEKNVESRYAFLVVIVGFLLSVWTNWWLIAVWLAVLFGLIGGSVPGMAERRQRLVSMLAALYLLSMLLIWVVPHLFPGQVVEDAMVLLVRYGIPALPIAIVLIRVESGRASAPVAVDLFYSVILFLLVAALVLGSFVVKQLSHGNYPLALAQTLFAIALLLVTLSWLWDPHGGFAGIGHFLSRYLMSLGLPFERWVQQLAEFAEQEAQPQRFLSLALRHILDLPWVTGLEWEARQGQGEYGVKSGYSAEFSFRDLRLRIYTRWSLSPAVLLHLKLLTQMVGHFYDAKRREEIQRQSAYTQAIYETGARLTHDVKNLLQSLRSLCAAVETSGADQAQALQTLMQRQLPQITQRLNTTLDKLRSPQPADATHVDAAAWWEGLIQRYSGRNLQFQADGPAKDLKLPAELFDGVADNLIENALRKAAGGELQVRVTFSAARGGTLTVCDNGAEIPKSTAEHLFQGPVPSQAGLGVALFQSAKQAGQLGYRLALAANQRGMVCFVLTREA
ncbi:MAG: HAMP domain-containing histidine kinase [Betaproteobacteria bacterium]|nr:HAMP domain-containing histidine kinase [Betaproteobacteria bacterium]